MAERPPQIRRGRWESKKKFICPCGDRFFFKAGMDQHRRDTHGVWSTAEEIVAEKASRIANKGA